MYEARTTTRGILALVVRVLTEHMFYLDWLDIACECKRM